MSSIYERQHIADESSERKYFHMMLNMADDDLDPHQYRLLGHYKRRCGETGYCDEAVRTTAELTKMSTEKVTAARDQLALLGYIRQEKPTREEARKGKTVYITIVDRWAENINRYTKNPVLNSAQLGGEGVGNSVHPVGNGAQAVGNSAQPPAEGVRNSARKKNEEQKGNNGSKNESPSSSKEEKSAGQEQSGTGAAVSPSSPPLSPPASPVSAYRQKLVAGLESVVVAERLRTLENILHSCTVDDDLLAALLKLEHDPNSIVRWNLALVLVRDQIGLDVLGRLQSDPDPRVRTTAQRVKVAQS